MNGETTENGSQSISTRRNPMNKTFVLIGCGLLTIALVGALVLVLILVNLPVQSTAVAPTNALSLPDLTITSAYVSTVDNNGNCLSYYGLNVTVVNQGNVPALDVILADNTGQAVGIGNLNPLQSTSVSFVAHAKSGAYTVIADPKNIIVESDENNNTAAFSEATATPVAFFLPSEFGDGTPMPTPTSIPFQVWPTATQQIMPITNAPTLSLDILRNGTYRSPDWGEFQLSDGIFYRTPPTSQESPETYTTRLSDTVLYGDINLDGFEDAVVFLYTQNGGTGHFFEMAAVLNFNGNLLNVSTLYLGDRVIIESGSVQGSWVSLNLRVHGPNDAACCPSQIVVRTFLFDGNQLIEGTP